MADGKEMESPSTTWDEAHHVLTVRTARRPGAQRVTRASTGGWRFPNQGAFLRAATGGPVAVRRARRPGAQRVGLKRRASITRSLRDRTRAPCLSESAATRFLLEVPRAGPFTAVELNEERPEAP